MIDEKFKQWLKLNYDTDKTIEDYMGYINEFFNQYDTFNQENINDYFFNKLEKGVKKSTFNKIIYSLKPYAIYSKIFIEFPKDKKVDKTIHTFVTLEELEQRILSMVDLIWKDSVKYDLLYRFMFFTGLRAEEVSELLKTNIDFENKIIKVINTKGKKDREVFSLDDKLFEDLEKYCKSTNHETVFNLSYQQIYYAIKRLENDFQIGKRSHPHFMRTSFAKYCVSLNINLAVIQVLMGHADPKTTMIYCEPTRDMVKEACEKAKRKGSI